MATDTTEGAMYIVFTGTATVESGSNTADLAKIGGVSGSIGYYPTQPLINMDRGRSLDIRAYTMEVGQDDMGKKWFKVKDNRDRMWGGYSIGNGGGQEGGSGVHISRSGIHGGGNGRNGGDHGGVKCDNPALLIPQMVIGSSGVTIPTTTEVGQVDWQWQGHTWGRCEGVS